MSRRPEDKWVNEVHSAIKYYQRADELKDHAAQRWPAVQELVNQGIDVVTAIRRILSEACQKLEATHASEVQLLYKQYIERRTPEAIADEEGFDKTTFHRWRNQALCELAVLITRANHDAKRNSSRFVPRLPVLGFEPLITDIVNRLYDDAAPPVIIIEGMGGLGKTTLAQSIAHRIETGEEYAGVLWVSAKTVAFDQWAGQRRLLPQYHIETRDLMHELARELHIHIPNDYTMLVNEVRTHCKNKKYLIVIDNLETIENVMALTPLIDMLVVPSRLLITTRDRTSNALPAELPRYYVPLSELAQDISFQLLRHAAAYHHSAGLSDANENELSQIYSVTGGNPLALWLVAGQARNVPWHVFIQNLTEQYFHGHKTYELYEYVYRRSWEQLSPKAQHVLIAMHRCEAGGEYNLLHLLSKCQPQELDFHGLVDRWSSWGLWATALDMAMSVSQIAGTIADQIRLLNYRSQAARELGKYQEALDYATQALRLAKRGAEPILLAISLNKIGLARLAHDELPAAQTYLEQAYTSGSDCLPPLELGHICMNLGLVAMRRGYLSDADTFFRKALDYYQTGDDAVCIAKALCSLVDIKRRAGSLTSIPQELLRAREIFHQFGVRYESGLAENDIGCIYLALGKFDQARQTFEAAIEISEHIGTITLKARVLSNLGELYVTHSEWDAAARTLEEARRLALLCEKPLLVATIDVDRGRLLLAQGNREGAQRLWQEALTVQEMQGADGAAQYTQQLLDTISE